MGRGGKEEKEKYKEEEKELVKEASVKWKKEMIKQQLDPRARKQNVEATEPAPFFQSLYGKLEF